MVEILPPESVLVGHGFHSDEPAVKELYEALARRSPSYLENTILSPEEWESGTRLVDGENLSLVYRMLGAREHSASWLGMPKRRSNMT